MASHQPFSLRIFVVDGDPDGLRIVERSNWIGRAVIFPRSLLPAVKERDEFAQTGVYLLIGPREDGEGEMLYVGEGDPVGPRLEFHYAKKDFWSRAVFFVAGSGQLNKAHVQFLEAQLIQKAKAAKRMPLDNVNQPCEPTLSEADEADMQVFLDNLLGILPVIGIHAFELAQRPGAEKMRNNLLFCHGKGIEARGFESSQGFVVLKDSQAVLTTAPSMKEHARGMYDLREELIQNAVLELRGDSYVFKQDYVFSSPSAASSVVLGRPSNGRMEWQDAQGRTLKAIQEAQAGALQGAANGA
ncbi:MAG: GIY-YIG nuclease family protein [Gammaproteobacteria bacterium]|nr:GIY-YIG nuclease family protein [Gammaproteobacteria bacterium]